VTNVDWQRGLIEQLPLADAAVDVVLLSQALHHAERPELALREACRVLVSGGRLLVLDLRAHEQTWVRERFDDRWLGFEDAAFRSMLTTAGFDEVDVRVGARLTGDPFTVLVASGVKRAPDRKAKGSR
jgi:ArsR family transcriptional regulator